MKAPLLFHFFRSPRTGDKKRGGFKLDAVLFDATAITHHVKIFTADTKQKDDIII